MSVECSECERDLRGGHDPSCSRYEPDDEEPRPWFEGMSDEEIAIEIRTGRAPGSRVPEGVVPGA